MTGRPGCGKSTIVKKVIEELEKCRDVKIAGIITPEIRKAGMRTGFKIIDLETGQEEVLASVDITRKPRVGKYGVNIKGIDVIVNKFMESFQDADLIVLDELGKMEFFSEKFKEMLHLVLVSKKPLLATLHRSLAKDYREKGDVIFITPENRDELTTKILRIILSRYPS